MDIDVLAEMKEKDKSLLLRLPADLHRQVKIAAAQEGVSMTAFVIDALEYYLSKIGATK